MSPYPQPGLHVAATVVVVSGTVVVDSVAVVVLSGTVVVDVSSVTVVVLTGLVVVDDATSVTVVVLTGLVVVVEESPTDVGVVSVESDTPSACTCGDDACVPGDEPAHAVIAPPDTSANAATPLATATTRRRDRINTLPGIQFTTNIGGLDRALRQISNRNVEPGREPAPRAPTPDSVTNKERVIDLNHAGLGSRSTANVPEPCNSIARRATARRT